MNIFLAALLCGLPAQVDAEEMVIGRWCDESVPGVPSAAYIITIRINDAGAVERHLSFANGGERTRPLDELSGNMFGVKGSGTGDKYLTTC